MLGTKIKKKRREKRRRRIAVRYRGHHGVLTKCYRQINYRPG
ncbi:unnamed protein product, partial [Arabidopsis halleri]